MTRLGIPELMIILMMSVFWVIPVAAAVWALVTLKKLHAGQIVVQQRLDAIERLLQRP